MIRELAKSCSKKVEYRIFPPPCSRPECCSSRLLRWHPPIRIQDAWVCSPRCMEREVRAIFEGLPLSHRICTPSVHRVPLGLLMLAHGDVEAQQLQIALQRQRDSGHGRIGAWLQTLHFAQRTAGRKRPRDTVGLPAAGDATIS